MQLWIAEAPQRAAADYIAERIASEEVRHLGLATGASTVELYGEFRAYVRDGRLATRHLWLSGLDEYVGADRMSSHGYAQELIAGVAAPFGVAESQWCFINGAAADPEREAAEFERRLLRNYPVDLQILGLGRNGHIAFNEPGSSFQSRTRVVNLAPETQTDNSRLNGIPVPSRAITQGIATIMSASELVMIVEGSHKAPALDAMLDDPTSTACPASALRAHPSVVIFADSAAAGELSLSRKVVFRVLAQPEVRHNRGMEAGELDQLVTGAHSIQPGFGSQARSRRRAPGETP